MKDFVILNPSGNITALVVDKEVKRKDYKSIANEILTANPEVEQVGFLKMVNALDTNVYRIEMMGMEFCGNAARAFACYLFKEGIEPSEEFFISVSGTNQFLKAKVKFVREDKYFSSIKLPFKKKISDIILPRNVDGIPVNIVVLDGITHILVDENDNKFDDEKYFEKAKYFIEKLELREREAVGVVWYDGGQISIKPVVWVKGTDTYYYENACGSGSMAFGIYLSTREKDDERFPIIQKNGEMISISVQSTDDIIEYASIEGVTIL